jgi:hypothetical protein
MPAIVQNVAPVVEQVGPAGTAETMYPVIGLPPFEAGAVHEIVVMSPVVEALTPLTEPGTPCAVAEPMVTGLELPAEFFATSVNV